MDTALEARNKINSAKRSAAQLIIIAEDAIANAPVGADLAVVNAWRSYVQVARNTLDTISRISNSDRPLAEKYVRIFGARPGGHNLVELIADVPEFIKADAANQGYLAALRVTTSMTLDDIASFTKRAANFPWGWTIAAVGIVMLWRMRKDTR